MRRFLSVFCGLLVYVGIVLAQQVLPSVGDERADAYITLLSQQGWRPEGASLSWDGQMLYLSLCRAPRTVHDLYCSRLVAGCWQAPVRLETLSTDRNEWSPSVSTDGCTLFFIRQEVVAEGTRKQQIRDMIYFSERAAGTEWPEAQWMLLSNGSDSHPHFLNDNRHLCFTSVGREEDERKPVPHRYWVRRIDKYNWTLPQLLPEDRSEENMALPVRYLSGVVLNQQSSLPIEAEVRVFDRLTDRCLQVHSTSSEGHFSLILPMGTPVRVEVSKPNFSKCYIQPADSLSNPMTTVVRLSPELEVQLAVYDDETMARLRSSLIVRDLATGNVASVSSRQDTISGIWTVGLPVGQRYELTFSAPAHADTSYIFDTRKDVLMTRTELDILLRIGHVSSSLVVVDEESGELLSEASTSFTREGEDEWMVFNSPMLLRCGTAYRIETHAPGYFFRDTLLYTPLVEGSFPIRMPLRRMRLSDVVQLQNIRFEFNSYVLREESYAELHRVAELLRQNPTVRIEISAHTDDVGSDDYNLRLSQRRGESARRYLVEEENIPAEQILSNGYGKSRPLVPNDTEEHRALNRRVEFSILEL